MSRISNSEWRRALNFIRLAPDRIVLLSQGVGIVLYARLDDGYNHPQRPGSGWEDEALTGQTSATVYRGTGAPTLALRVIFGGWPTQPRDGGQSCELALAYLRELYPPLIGAHRGKRPPLIKVRGNVRHEGAEWFIDDVQWGGERGDTIMNRQGKVVQAKATITLRRYVPVRLIKIDEDRAGGARDGRFYVVKRGDVRRGLSGIAHDQLDTRTANQNRAAVRDIQKLNPRIRDPRAIKVGQRIKLPPTASKMELTYR